MLTQNQINIRHKAIQVDVDAAYDAFVNRKIDQRKFDQVMTAAEAESTKLKTAQQTINKSMRFAAGASPEEYNPSAQSTAKGVRRKNLSPYDIPGGELQNMFEAAKRKMPYRVEVTNKAFSAGSPGVGFKTPGAPIAEGAQWPTGLFPPDLRPELTQELRYEIDRAADWIPTIDIEAPSIEYLVETGTTNQAAYVPEGGVKVDLGIQLDSQTAVPIKLAALASVTTEALQDFSYFASWVPKVLANAVINVETEQLVLGTGATGDYPGMTGFVNTPNVLTRSFNSATDTSGLDTLIESCTDIRVAPNVFGEADLILLHPTTWDHLKRTKTTTGAFVLAMDNPTSIGSLDNVFGVKVITNTFVPLGTGITLASGLAARYFVRQALTVDMNPWGDTEWTTNTISFRAEQRSTLAVLRPGAVNVVTGLHYSGS